MSNLLSQASLVMIPSGYKEDTVYSVVPSDGSGDLSFTRASNGTRINSAGLVEVTPWNMQTYSEDFSNASWAKNNSPVMSYNVATAPNGTMTADSIQSNTASFYQSVSAPSLSIAPNSTVTLSIYIKKETSKTYFGGTFLYFTGGTTKLTYVLFDEVNGTINIVAPDQVSMVTSVESVGDWWRFIVTGTDTGSNTQLDFSFYGTLSQNGTSLSPGIGSVRTIWGAQLNIGATAKPYFPTTDRLNVPRLTYQNGGGGCPSLLLEKQSTNLITYSEQFDNGNWFKEAITVSANATTSPDGTQNADTLTPTTANQIHRIEQDKATATQVFTQSIFAKANGYNFIALENGGEIAYFNISTGVVGTVSSGTASIQNMGNGWYRCIFTATALNGKSYFYVANADNSISFAGNGTSGIYVWGAQFEASSYSTSYIQSTSSSATRVADACFKTGISSLIGQTEGVVFCDFINVPNLSFSDVLSIGAVATGLVELQTSGGSTINAVYYNGGTLANIPALSTMTIGQRYKAAFAYKTNDFVFYLNGVQQGTDTSGTVTSGMAEISLNGFGSSTSNNENATINQVALFPTRLTNAELASLTTI